MIPIIAHVLRLVAGYVLRLVAGEAARQAVREFYPRLLSLLRRAVRRAMARTGRVLQSSAMRINYWVVGLPPQQPAVMHSVRLKHEAAPGQTLTYEESGEVLPHRGL
jgi:hypothetical protein